MNKYQWASSELQQKAKTYSWLMILFAVLTLGCLYLLPQTAKMANFIPLIGGIVMWYLWWRTIKQDNKLKKTTK